MKINIILPEFGLSGGVIVILKYAKALTDFGHDVKIYAKKTPYNKPKTFKSFAHAIHRLCVNYDAKLAQKRCWNFDYEVPMTIKDQTIRNADIVIATAWCTAFDVANLSKDKGEKFYFIQGYEVWDDKEKGIESYKLPLKHIVIAKWIEDILVKEHGCSPGTIVNNGVDLEIFKPDKNKRRDSLTISMMNHTLPKKGINDGLEVLSRIHKDFPDIKMIMFGKPSPANCPDFIEYYRDPSPELLVNIYQQSDIFLFPAREEGWGLTVIEAMACGCAIVGTEAGCLLEMGENGVTALISEPGKPKQLENNLRKLLKDRELLNELRSNSLKSVEKLSWETSYKKFEKILLGLA